VAGKKIDPKEIEEVLLKYDPITDVAVFGKTSSKTKMDVLCAAVISTEPLTRADIVDFIRERLASYKIPQKFIFLDHLPRNSSGKVLRTKLVEMITDF
jgi:acyl-CoA synthetase (AMP-forming)/AMP-acid ligase II